MTVQYYLHTIVGVPLSKDALIELLVKNHEGCECPYPERKGHGLCPDCKHDMFENESDRFIKGFNLYKKHNQADCGIYGMPLDLSYQDEGATDIYSVAGNQVYDDGVKATNGAILTVDDNLKKALSSVEKKLMKAGMSVDGLNIYTIVRVSI